MKENIMDVKLDISHILIGEFVDTLTRYDEQGNVVEVIEKPMQKNIITKPISILMAGLIQGKYLGNNAYWAVGTGSQASSPDLTNLVAEFSRKKASIQFVDNSNSVTVIPTNRLIMSVSWAKGELGVVTLTEFGLFSGDGASSASGGLMMDYVPHAPISLDATLSLSRKIYFTF